MLDRPVRVSADGEYEVVAMLVVHVDDVKVAATKEITNSVVAEITRDSLRNVLAKLRGTWVASTREVVRREPQIFRKLSLFEMLSNCFGIKKNSPISASPSFNLRHVSDEDPAVDERYREMVRSLMWIL